MDNVKEKIAKLMAMATDGRGNEFEAEAALRQAQKMMAKHNIDIAEISAASGQAPAFDWVTVSVPAGAPTPVRNAPRWFSCLALGIARFTDCRVALKTINGHGACVAFSGDDSDVQYAVWIAKLLRDTIRRESASFAGDRVDKEAFRMAMSSRLIDRMRALKAEASADMRRTATPGSSALTIVANKVALRDEVFGVQQSRASRGSVRSNYGASAGHAAGDKVGFGRPVAHARAALGQF